MQLRILTWGSGNIANWETWAGADRLSIFINCLNGYGNGYVGFNLGCLNRDVCNIGSYTNLIDSLRNKIF